MLNAWSQQTLRSARMFWMISKDLLRDVMAVQQMHAMQQLPSVRWNHYGAKYGEILVQEKRSPCNPSAEEHANRTTSNLRQRRNGYKLKF